MCLSDPLMNKQKIHIKFNIYIVIIHIDVACQEANCHAVLTSLCEHLKNCDQYSAQCAFGRKTVRLYWYVLKHDKYALIQYVLAQYVLVRSNKTK